MSDKLSIQKLEIGHYGPLHDIELDLDSGFNAFYGGNESGKTLIVEALTKMLMDDSSSFEGIGRVPQQPNGLLTVDNGEKEFEASQESLEKVFGDATPGDVRNAFIVRDFDLRIPEKENDFGNGDYFKDVTDRVLGSKTQKIEALRDEISDIGYLTNKTSDAKLENTKRTGKLRDRKDEAEGLREEIEEFIDQVEEENLFEKYSKIDSLEKRIKSGEKKLSELKNARKQKKHRKGLHLLEELRDAEEKMERVREEKKEFEDLKDLRKEAEAFQEEDLEVRGSKFAAIGSGLVSASAFGAAAFNPVLPVLGAAAVSVLVAAFFAEKYRKGSKQVKKQEKERDRLIERAEAREIEASTVPEVIEAIDSYGQKLESEEKEASDKKSKALGELKGLFNADLESIEDWEKELNGFSNSFEDVERGFEEGDIEEAREEVQGLEEEKQRLEQDIEQYDEVLGNFDTGISETVKEKFVEGEVVEVRSVQYLSRASRQLDEFISNLEEAVEASLDAITVLEEMEEEEEDEFNKVFNEDSYAVEMFRKATDGNYTDIKYDKGSRKLKVVRKDERELEPEALSQGTYDLLYMAVRLKLAKEILGKPGFLVLDNAFVHSDAERVKREIEFLKMLEEEGWQIIYFTFRDDVKEVLEEVTDVKELEALEF